MRRLTPQTGRLRLRTQGLRLGAGIKRARFQAQEITLLQMYKLGARCGVRQCGQLHAQLTPADLGIAHQPVRGQMRGVQKALCVPKVRRRREMLSPVMGDRRLQGRSMRRFQQGGAQRAHLGAGRLDPLRVTLGGVFQKARQLQRRLRPPLDRG